MARTLLVLGARNLGGAIAAHYAGKGWNVAAVARSEATASTVRERLPDALALALDASTPDGVEEAVARTRERFGSLELMVNAASPGARPGSRFGGGPLADATLDDFDHYANGVTRQVFAFLGAGARALRESGGTLVQITGGSARRARAGLGPWAAGAAATRALTQAAALELRESGVHVALLIVDATIASPKTAGSTSGAAPDALTTNEDVAEAVAALEAQSPRAWTHELQITPRGDTWVP